MNKDSYFTLQKGDRKVILSYGQTVLYLSLYVISIVKVSNPNANLTVVIDFFRKNPKSLNMFLKLFNQNIFSRYFSKEI